MFNNSVNKVCLALSLFAGENTNHAIFYIYKFLNSQFGKKYVIILIQWSNLSNVNEAHR